ncbi:MAG: flagellar biosynthesis protein FlhB [Ignavibacteria bacterium]
MAEFETAEQRTEPASHKKRTDARAKGSVAKSIDVNSALVIVFGLLILSIGGAGLAAKLSAVAQSVFGSLSAVNLTPENVHRLVADGLSGFFLALMPILFGLMLVGVIASVAQVGFLFTWEPVLPKFSKMNPLAGLRRVMLSARSVVELSKGIAKVAIVGLVAYNATQAVVSDAVLLVDSDAAAILEFMVKASLNVGWKVGLAFFVLAAADYAFQRWEHEKSLRMTKHEVKEESKEAEGDPTIKGRIRAIQRQIAYRRMMQDVPKADVVVTNPTHLAVALKYEMEKMNAPRVVAKGADLLAQRIKEIAREHDVPIVEDKPLAQMLYKTVEVGDEIPEKLFQAVAQVLAFVYRLRDERRPHFTVN